MAASLAARALAATWMGLRADTYPISLRALRPSYGLLVCASDAAGAPKARTTAITDNTENNRFIRDPLLCGPARRIPRTLGVRALPRLSGL